MSEKIKPKDKPHYVNNREFSEAVEEYVISVRESETQNQKTPIVTDYIAQCFLNIANGLAHKSNFSRYTFKEEMVMDAVENCLKAIQNYKISTETRTGNPNAFSYFTQISWYAFLRRIAKEKKQVELKNKFLMSSQPAEDLINKTDQNSVAHREVYQYFVEQLRLKIDEVHSNDESFKEFVKEEEKKKKRYTKHVDSDLSDFIENDFEE